MPITSAPPYLCNWQLRTASRMRASTIAGVEIPGNEILIGLRKAATSNAAAHADQLSTVHPPRRRNLLHKLPRNAPRAWPLNPHLHTESPRLSYSISRPADQKSPSPLPPQAIYLSSKTATDLRTPRLPHPHTYPIMMRYLSFSFPNVITHNFPPTIRDSIVFQVCANPLQSSPKLPPPSPQPHASGHLHRYRLVTVILPAFNPLRRLQQSVEPRTPTRSQLEWQ